MRLENKYNTKISTRLSVILRHDKGKFNLRFYPNAAAELREILKLTKNDRGQGPAASYFFLASTTTASSVAVYSLANSRIPTMI